MDEIETYTIGENSFVFAMMDTFSEDSLGHCIQ